MKKEKTNIDKYLTREVRMTPGPEVIISCPECKALSRFSTMASGNTFGSTLWSDGYRLFPDAGTLRTRYSVR